MLKSKEFCTELVAEYGRERPIHMKNGIRVLIVGT